MAGFFGPYEKKATEESQRGDDHRLELGHIFRWLYGLVMGRPMNFSFIDDKVAGCAGPLRKKEVDWLRDKKGIGAILSVREGPLVSGWVEGLKYLNIPVRDHHPPTLEQLKVCVDFVVTQTDSGTKTVVHCMAGQGRTGTVLAAYLCRKRNLEADESIKLIRKMRPHSVEKSQVAVIHEYCRRYNTS